jgi:hypothetical protein
MPQPVCAWALHGNAGAPSASADSTGDFGYAT